MLLVQPGERIRKRGDGEMSHKDKSQHLDKPLLALGLFLHALH